jgi:hypothetical protein
MAGHGHPRGGRLLIARLQARSRPRPSYGGVLLGAGRHDHAGAPHHHDNGSFEHRRFHDHIDPNCGGRPG